MHFLRSFLAALSLIAISAAASAATTLAPENGNFTLSQPAAVSFGAGSRWVTVNMLAGTYQCSTSVFGDPAFGVVKSCQTESAPAPAATTSAASSASGGTVTLAAENGSFTLTQATTVRFGAGTQWASRNLAAGTYQCSNTVFGDPAFNVVKSCVTDGAADATATTADTHSFTPPCYPWDGAAQATKVTTQPDGNLQWMLASASQASWIVTWFCADASGALPQSISGYRTDIAPFQVLDAFRSGTKEERDAAWTASATCTSNMDPNSASCQKYGGLKPLIRAQLAATCPAGCLLDP